MTANAEIGKDADEFFKNMCMGELKGEYANLLVAPHSFKQKLLLLMDQEILKGSRGAITMKLNSLTDIDVIHKLSEASQAGVEVRLIIRGICCILPGVPGKTDHVSVISIVGRYLEHSRIYSFGKESEQKLYIASADLMTRNTERRVEVACPVLDPEIKQRLNHILEVYFYDNLKARQLTPNGDYMRIQGNRMPLNAQVFFCDEYAKAAVPKAILETPEGKAMFEGKFSNPLKLMKYAKEVITPSYRKTMDDFLEAAAGADLMIYHPKALGACDIAEFYGIPAVCMPPVPITYPIKEFPNLALSPTGNFGPTFNKLSYSINQLAESSYLKQINEFRQTRLNMKPRRAGAYKDSVGQHPLRTFYPISPSLFEDVSSWDGHVNVTGFCFTSENGRALDPDVETFLNEGEPPLLITFSSMPLKDPEKFLEDLAKALEATKMRAILLTGSSGLKTMEQDHLVADKSDNLFDAKAVNLLTIKAAPHRLIMPLCSGIIHHGGAGTTAEALLSGVPQAIIPFNVDQPFWANRLYHLGLSVKPLKAKDLREETLKKLIQELQNPELRKRSNAFKVKIKAEDGVVRILKLLEEILKN